MHTRTIGRLASTVAVLTLAACGAATASVGNNGGGATPTVAPSTPSPQTTPAPVAAVRTVSVNGLGTVLADAQGRTLYYFVPERGGKVACLGQCASIWLPVPAPSTTPSGNAGVAGQFGSEWSPAPTERHS